MSVVMPDLARSQKPAMFSSLTAWAGPLQCYGMSDPEQQLAGFMAKYTPEIAARGRAAIDRLQARLPTAFRLVYDNYNALAVGFVPDERTSNAILSVVFYPRWITLFFLQGAGLHDPHRILKGSGNVVRHVVLAQPDDLDRPDISAMIDQALVCAKVPLKAQGEGRLIIKSVSAKQRPRRPAHIDAPA